MVAGLSHFISSRRKDATLKDEMRCAKRRNEAMQKKTKDDKRYAKRRDPPRGKTKFQHARRKYSKRNHDNRKLYFASFRSFFFFFFFLPVYVISHGVISTFHVASFRLFCVSSLSLLENTP